MNLTELAQRIKRLRLERGMTLEEVASAAGLSRGWLSKVENFRVTPSLPALGQISEVLGIPLSDLFEGLNAKPALSIVRQQERVSFRRDEPVSLIQYESLAQQRKARNMDPFLLTVPREDQRPRMTHDGEEFLLVIAGSVRLEYGEEAHDLIAGDAAYFDGEEEHRLICLSDEPAQVLVVYNGLTGSSLKPLNPEA